MPRAIRTASCVLALIIAGVTMAGCTPWLESRMSQTERALNCAVLAVNVPGNPTTQGDACAQHPGSRKG